MSHEITMPQLGMAQDSGIIVSWLKKPGDPIKSTDILMEVETDKATMEVEAGHDGFLAEIRADAGSDVPIGEVIAVISHSLDDVKTEAVSATPQPDEPTGVAEPERQPETTSQPAKIAPPKPAPADTIYASADRILASPKARRLAHERGHDLRQLARRGVGQPFHVADLKQLEGQTASGVANSSVTASVKRKHIEEFADWAKQESDGAVTQAAIWLAFASAALRDGRDTEFEIHANYQSLNRGGAVATAIDADLCGLAHPQPGSTGRAIDVSIIDLTETSLDGYTSGYPEAEVTFVIARKSKKKLRLTLQFQQNLLPPERAAELMNGFASRVAEPLRHLL